MAALSFNGITRARFEQIAADAHAKSGVEFIGDSGDVNFKGCRGSYAYSEGAQRLDITLNSAPFGMMTFAKAAIKKMVQG